MPSLIGSLAGIAAVGAVMTSWIDLSTQRSERRIHQDTVSALRTVKTAAVRWIEGEGASDNAAGFKRYCARASPCNAVEVQAAKDALEPLLAIHMPRDGLYKEVSHQITVAVATREMHLLSGIPHGAGATMAIARTDDGQTLEVHALGWWSNDLRRFVEASLPGVRFGALRNVTDPNPSRRSFDDTEDCDGDGDGDDDEAGCIGSMFIEIPHVPRSLSRPGAMLTYAADSDGRISPLSANPLDSTSDATFEVDAENFDLTANSVIDDLNYRLTLSKSAVPNKDKFYDLRLTVSGEDLSRFGPDTTESVMLRSAHDDRVTGGQRLKDLTNYARTGVTEGQVTFTGVINDENTQVFINNVLQARIGKDPQALFPAKVTSVSQMTKPLRYRVPISSGTYPKSWLTSGEEDVTGKVIRQINIIRVPGPPEVVSVRILAESVGPADPDANTPKIKNEVMRAMRIVFRREDGGDIRTLELDVPDTVTPGGPSGSHLLRSYVWELTGDLANNAKSFYDFDTKLKPKCPPPPPPPDPDSGTYECGQGETVIKEVDVMFHNTIADVTLALPGQALVPDPGATTPTAPAGTIAWALDGVPLNYTGGMWTPAFMGNPYCRDMRLASGDSNRNEHAAGHTPIVFMGEGWTKKHVDDDADASMPTSAERVVRTYPVEVDGAADQCPDGFALNGNFCELEIEDEALTPEQMCQNVLGGKWIVFSAGKARRCVGADHHSTLICSPNRPKVNPSWGVPGTGDDVFAPCTYITHRVPGDADSGHVTLTCEPEEHPVRPHCAMPSGADASG